MIPSSTLCRTQENLHRLRAEDTTLDNVRLVANNAADAWAKEAVAAERREERQERVRAVADAAGTREAELNDAEAPAPNENPDRGLADVQPMTNIG